MDKDLKKLFKIFVPETSHPLKSFPPPQDPAPVFMNLKPGNPLDEAQEIMYDAFEAPTDKEAIALARKALAISEDCADAFTLLAEKAAKTSQEAVDLYRKGVEGGRRAVGEQVFKEDAGFFWGVVETRPYMRALSGLAQSLWKNGDRDEAIKFYWEALQLNTNDNLGLRYLLLPSLLEMGLDKEAEKLFEQFKGDGMASWNYSKALLDFRKHGNSPIAKKSLNLALRNNKYVPAYLLQRKKMPKQVPDYYGLGDINEAIMVARGNQSAWKATPGALEWLQVNL